MTTTADAFEAGQATREQRSLLVDCDMHPLIRDTGVLAPRMSKRVARRIFGSHVGTFARDPNRIPHPSSGLRLDALPPSGGPAGCDPAHALEQWLDPYGIDAAVLIPVQSGVVIPWGDERAAVEFISAFNDHLLEDWHGLDNRYRVTISIPPHDPAAALREVERLADVDGVCAIFVPHASVSLGRRQWWPLYEFAAAKGLPIVVHPTGAESNLVEAPWVAGGLPRNYPERHSLLLHPGQGMLTSLVFSGVFDAIPGLTVVLSEYGFSWVPSVTMRMDDAWERGDRELAGIERAPSAYVRDHLRFTTQPLDEPADRRDLWKILELMDADRTLLFSSDYPHWDTDDPDLILRTRLPHHLRDRIAWRSAAETFGARLGLGFDLDP
jgi:predicted TIM-barrel fold metal-dependent hydrolase